MAAGGGGGAGVSVNETTTVRAPLIVGVDISENAPGAAVTVKTARFGLAATAMVTPLPVSSGDPRVDVRLPQLERRLAIGDLGVGHADRGCRSASGRRSGSSS